MSGGRRTPDHAAPDGKSWPRTILPNPPPGAPPRHPISQQALGKSKSGGCCSPPTRSSPAARGTAAPWARGGTFPTEQAALKCLYLVTRGLDPKGTGQARCTMRWKPALNAFAVTLADPMPAAENL